MYVIRSRSLDCPKVFQPSAIVAGTRYVDEMYAKTEIRVMEGFLLSIYNISWTTLAGVGIGAYLIAVILYRLTLHPLAKHPGPLLGRITDWYSVYQAWSGDRHLDFIELHEKYGPFVRFGPNRISVNTNEGLKEIYGMKCNTRKASYYKTFAHVFKGDSSNTIIDPEKHGRKKRVVTQALSENSIRAMEEHILNNVRTFCRLMCDGNHAGSDGTKKAVHEEWSTPKDMTRWAGCLTFDIMGDICFSHSFEMLEKEENRYILDMLPRGVQGLNIVAHMQGLLALHLDKVLFRRLDKDMQRYQAFSKRQSDTRVSKGDNVPIKDVFSFLIDAKDPETGSGFEMPELVGEASLLITGGSDTTATAITSTIFYLLHNPSTLEGLTHQVLSLFPTLESIRGGVLLSQARYLKACVDEAMRMSPGVPGLLPREVQPGGLSISGTHFPPGTDMGVPHYAIHHNEAYYPDSFAYKPERWIADDKAGWSVECVALAQSAFCPFSIGPRGCVGKALAMKEIMIVVARLIWLFEMRISEGTRMGEGSEPLGRGRTRSGEFQMRDMFVGKAEGPLVEFRARRTDARVVG
ncbi:hypothetical protein IMSHALPRED_001332 [Imshaugia aleurites]|uniref:Cytochrome P450 n=1 Tax=Imshaugia aleurites TaxID=172621 RepID=A0A8H3PF14_9LECA|nr:hypothetical protein IMSHALPRED_001332 [Imshaugia aleurites]